MLWILLVGCFSEFPGRDFPPSLVIEQPTEEYRTTEGEVFNDGTPIPFTLQISDNDTKTQDLYVRGDVLQELRYQVPLRGLPSFKGS